MNVAAANTFDVPKQHLIASAQSFADNLKVFSEHLGGPVSGLACREDLDSATLDRQQDIRWVLRLMSSFELFLAQTSSARDVQLETDEEQCDLKACATTGTESSKSREEWRELQQQYERLQRDYLALVFHSKYASLVRRRPEDLVAISLGPPITFRVTEDESPDVESDTAAHTNSIKQTGSGRRDDEDRCTTSRSSYSKTIASPAPTACQITQDPVTDALGSHSVHKRTSSGQLLKIKRRSLVTPGDSICLRSDIPPGASARSSISADSEQTEGLTSSVSSSSSGKFKLKRSGTLWERSDSGVQF